MDFLLFDYSTLGNYNSSSFGTTLTFTVFWSTIFIPFLKFLVLIYIVIYLPKIHKRLKEIVDILSVYNSQKIDNSTDDNSDIEVIE